MTWQLKYNAIFTRRESVAYISNVETVQDFASILNMSKKYVGLRQD